MAKKIPKRVNVAIFEVNLAISHLHIVALTVKLIYGIRIRNDVMDGVELDDVKLRYIERLSKKSNSGIVTNFACSNIR